jgi:hypothetical protein
MNRFTVKVVVAALIITAIAVGVAQVSYRLVELIK